VLEKAPDSEACGVRMPFSVPEVFGTRARVPVRGTLNGFAFRSSLSPMGGCHVLPVNREMREGSGTRAGDVVEIVLERDGAPRTVEEPDDLRAALDARPGARARWEALSYTHRKEYARHVEEAKKPETRARRLEKVLSALAPDSP
jgi:hypothetical protein